MTSREFRSRLTERARRAAVSVSTEVADQLEAYYRLLSRWNASISLTSLQLESLGDETVDRLLIEPLAAARYVADVTANWFDLGSGGGSPAIPLKILRPATKLVMIESKARKAAFLREALRVLNLHDAEVENERFEAVAARMPGMAQIVTVRAVRSDAALFAATATLLVEGGRMLWFNSGHRLAKVPAVFRPLGTLPLSGSPVGKMVLLERVFHVEQTG